MVNTPLPPPTTFYGCWLILWKPVLLFRYEESVFSPFTVIQTSSSKDRNKTTNCMASSCCNNSLLWRGQALTCPCFSPVNRTVMRGTSGSRPHFTDMIWPPCQEMFSHRRRSCRQGRQLSSSELPLANHKRKPETGWERAQGEGWGCLLPWDSLNYLNAAGKDNHPTLKNTGNERKLK